MFMADVAIYFAKVLLTIFTTASANEYKQKDIAF